jgi:hypothetical protein
MVDESSRSVRIIELIARDDVVKGTLLRQAVEEAEQLHQAEVIDCDISAHNARIQQTLFELGFLPVAYVPGMVFHNTTRWDVVKMMKLNVPWDLGAIELSESSRAMFNIVTPPFIVRDEVRRRKHPARAAAVLKGLTSLEVDFVEHAGEELNCLAGQSQESDGLYIVLEGEVLYGERTIGLGQSLGAWSLLRRLAGDRFTAVSAARLLRLSLESFDVLCDRHPRLGLKLYRNLAENIDCE